MNKRLLETKLNAWRIETPSCGTPEAESFESPLKCTQSYPDFLPFPTAESFHYTLN